MMCDGASSCDDSNSTVVTCVNYSNNKTMMFLL